MLISWLIVTYLLIYEERIFDCILSVYERLFLDMCTTVLFFCQSQNIQWLIDSTLIGIRLSKLFTFRYMRCVTMFLFDVLLFFFAALQKNVRPINWYDDNKFLTFLGDECYSYCHWHSIATDGKVRCCNMRNLANHVSKLKATIGRWHRNTVVEGKWLCLLLFCHAFISKYVKHLPLKSIFSST